MEQRGYIDLLIYKCDVATGSITIWLTIIHNHRWEHVHHPGFRFNLLLFCELILDLSWVQQSCSPSTYYQSASSLTFREDEDKREGEPDSGRRERGETATSAFNAKHIESRSQVWPFREIPFLPYGLWLLSWLFPLHAPLVALSVAQIAGLREVTLFFTSFCIVVILPKTHACQTVDTLSEVGWVHQELMVQPYNEEHKADFSLVVFFFFFCNKT